MFGVLKQSTESQTVYLLLFFEKMIITFYMFNLTMEHEFEARYVAPKLWHHKHGLLYSLMPSSL
jgi:hypothetical protein